MAGTTGWALEGPPDYWSLLHGPSVDGLVEYLVLEGWEPLPSGQHWWSLNRPDFDGDCSARRGSPAQPARSAAPIVPRRSRQRLGSAASVATSSRKTRATGPVPQRRRRDAPSGCGHPRSGTPTRGFAAPLSCFAANRAHAWLRPTGGRGSMASRQTGCGNTAGCFGSRRPRRTFSLPNKIGLDWTLSAAPEVTSSVCLTPSGPTTTRALTKVRATSPSGFAASDTPSLWKRSVSVEGLPSERPSSSRRDRSWAGQWHPCEPCEPCWP